MQCKRIKQLELHDADVDDLKTVEAVCLFENIENLSFEWSNIDEIESLVEHLPNFRCLSVLDNSKTERSNRCEGL